MLQAPLFSSPAADPTHQSGGHTHPSTNSVHRIFADQQRTSRWFEPAVTVWTVGILQARGPDSLLSEFAEPVQSMEPSLAGGSGVTRREPPLTKDGQTIGASDAVMHVQVVQQLMQ